MFSGTIKPKVIIRSDSDELLSNKSMDKNKEV